MARKGTQETLGNGSGLSNRTLWFLGAKVLVLTYSVFAMPLHAATRSKTAGQPDDDCGRVVVSPANIEAVVRANAILGTKLGRELIGKELEAGKNFFFSPYSIATAWAMVSMGATSETLDEMLQLFGRGTKLAELAFGNRGLKESITELPSLVTANSVWVAKDLQLVDGFETNLKNTFGATFNPTTFGVPAAARAINDWVAKNTAPLSIRDLIKQTSKSDLVYLVNAIALKVNWKEAFDRSKTTERSFSGTTGKIDVPTMYKSGRFQYLHEAGVQGVSLETEDGGTVVDLFLPDEELTTQQLVDFANVERIAELSQGFESQKGEIYLPRLKMKWGGNLIPAAQANGVRLPFSTAVENFPKMVEGKSGITLFQHAALMELDEVGVRASAATAVGTTRGLSQGPPPFLLDFSRPFVVSVRHVETGANLFFGVVADPRG